ncbi:MAG TPA: hypothetical protein DCW68_04405 [Rhodospirillaceae bacterium]|nr:MAG: hypothetical protein A2018_03245 [Alphaproteobacteria bacterium GWF2_58_20]HAU29338.1 hypothetical protein [Rhodospirillaceae bacterium]
MKPPPFSNLPALRALAITGTEDPFLCLNNLEVNTDGVMQISASPRPSKCQFHFGNTLYNISISPDTPGCAYNLWAVLGTLPYTAENLQARQNLLAILRGSRKSSNDIKLAITPQQQIVLLANRHFDHHLSVQDFLTETMCIFLQTRSMLSLLHDHIPG